MKKKLLAVVISVVIILLVIFDEVIISFLSQFKTNYTLLNYSNFWNEKIHDWLGDTITLVGVMLAFSLPFVAQVVQWIVGTYGVTNFPEITRNRLKIHNLLIKMFIFVGFVIFWRVFIFDISPYTKSLYVFFNIGISILFLWILWRLFIVVNFIIKCTFEFSKFIIDPAYKYIKNITEDIPTPYNQIEDFSAIPIVSIEYIQYIELLRDNEISSFKRGNILINKNEEFEKFVWNYITAIFFTNDSERIKEAILLHKKLSSSLRKMCSVFGKEYYSRYVTLASGLVYYTTQNRYYIFDSCLTVILEKEGNSERSLYEKKSEEYKDFSKYYADILFLAEEIEGKSQQDYCPILSCQYLLNHSSFSYLNIFNLKRFDEIERGEAFEQINRWEDDIISLSRQLILIARRYKKSSALLAVYSNIRNDLQFRHQREVSLYRYIQSDPESVNDANQIAQKFSTIENVKELEECIHFFLSNQLDQYFKIDDEKKVELLQNLLRIRYKFKIDNLLLFWLGHLSYDTSIIINILEETSPIDLPRINDVGSHFMPKNIRDTIKQYLIVYNNEFELHSRFDNSEEYQIVFSTIVLYFLLKELRSHVEDIDTLQMAKQIYTDKKITIRNIKSIADIATLWKSSPKGLETNQGIIDLCVNYGVNFKKLKSTYNSFLTNLIDIADEAINVKILNSPIDDSLIQELYQNLNEKIKKLFNKYEFKINSISDLNNTNHKYRFMVINREWFIDAETGVHYVRDNLSDQFYYQCKFFLKNNIGKNMNIVDGSSLPIITFSYKEVGNKLHFYCEYNFYFSH